MSVILASCSTLENNQLYQSWQKQAYNAYGMQVPAARSNPYMTTEMYPSMSGITSANDLRYIAEYYALR